MTLIRWNQGAGRDRISQGNKQDKTLPNMTCKIHYSFLQHTDLQLLLAQTEKNYFETKLKLDRMSGEKQAALQENQSLERDRDDLRHKLRQIAEENAQIKERWVYRISQGKCIWRHLSCTRQGFCTGKAKVKDKDHTDKMTTLNYNTIITTHTNV